MVVYKETTEKVEIQQSPPLFSLKSRRFHLVMLIMFGFCGTTFMRANIALAMTCMVNSTALAILETNTDQSFLSTIGSTLSPMLTAVRENSTVVPSGCQVENAQSTNGKVVVDYGGSLLWDSETQNLLFAGTFWGALVVVLPSVLIIHRWSPRYLILFAMVNYMLNTILTPFLSNNWGYEYVFVVRVLMGFGESIVMPACNAMVANWFPVEEKSTAIALFTTGVVIAMSGGNPLAAALCASSWGWESIFYISAAYGIFWSILWLFLSTDYPADCKIMSKAEREYLDETVPHRIAKNKKAEKIPYRAILTSPPFWAVCLALFTINFYATFMQTYLPSYFKEVLYLEVVTNGLFTALPYIFNSCVNLSYSISLDKLKQKKLIAPTTACKFSQCMSNFGTGAAVLIIALFGDCSRPYFVLAVLCISYMFLGMVTCGLFTSLLSLAPKYTSTLSSISLFPAMIGRLLSPYIVTLIKTTGAREEWNRILIVISIVSIVTGIVFAIYGSAEIQPWGMDIIVTEEDEMKELREKEEKEEKKEERESIRREKREKKPRTTSIRIEPRGLISASDLTASAMSIDRVI